MSRVQQFAEGSSTAGRGGRHVADGLSALGLYITALQQAHPASRVWSRAVRSARRP
jgi:hypothetical protein